jgi:hypothetical protein
MKSSILLLALFSAIAFSSCTTAYKTGQTPDDVYYSPTRPQDEYVNTQNEENKYQNDDGYYSDEYYDDRYLRMKVRDRYRWSDLDDQFYYSRKYNYTVCNCSCNNPWNPYTFWNNNYNPYYKGYVIINPKSPTYSRPRTFNLNAYNNNQITTQKYTTVYPKYNSGTNNNTYIAPRTTNTRQNDNSGSFLRNIFSSGGSKNNSSSNSSTNNTNSSSPSSSSSNGSSTAPVRRF